ncbi:MAG: hypothetical protein NC121_14185 [Blautia sp.]|nr:hypothetical protein [Blautia sp.]
MMREEGYLNDLFYEDRPMRLIVPDPLQRVDEQELEQSRMKNREMIMEIRKKQQEMAFHKVSELPNY